MDPSLTELLLRPVSGVENVIDWDSPVQISPSYRPLSRGELSHTEGRGGPHRPIRAQSSVTRLWGEKPPMRKEERREDNDGGDPVTIYSNISLDFQYCPPSHASSRRPLN